MDEAFFAPLELRGRHVCDVSVTAQSPGLGRIGSPWGATMVDYIAEGEFEGPGMRGRVLPGGGDWPSISNDGDHSMKIDARAVWETHDGAKIFVRYEGYVVFPEAIKHGPVDIMKLDPAEYYLRTMPIFRTDAEPYLWLNKTVCVGVGRFAAGGLGYRVYAID